MQFLGFRRAGSAAPTEVNDLSPLPVYVPTDAPPLRVGRTLSSGYQQPDGIGTGAAYSDGEAIGKMIRFPGVLREDVRSGQLYSATYLDLDDEGLQVDLHLFTTKLTYSPSDNNAYSPTDADMMAYIGTVSFLSFYNLGANQVSVGTFSPIAVANAPSVDVWGQVVARGALNIAANNLPMFRLVWLAD